MTVAALPTSWLRNHRDIVTFQAANLAFSLWLVWCIHARPVFPWQDLLAMEALIWISTAPFYSQSATIGALAPEESRRYGWRITVAKLCIAAVALAAWTAARDPSLELMAAGALSFGGAALLPQWMLFRDRFQEYTISLALCRVSFVGAMLLGIESVAVLLILYGLQHPVSAAVVWRFNRFRRAGLSAAASIPVGDFAATSLAFTARYTASAVTASSLLLYASAGLLPLLALLDRIVRPIVAALGPYLLRSAQQRAAPAYVATAARTLLWLSLPLSLAAAHWDQLLLAYMGLLMVEAAAVFHFLGTRYYRSRVWLGLSGASFTLTTAAALVPDILAPSLAVGLLAAGQLFLMRAERVPPPESVK